MGLGIESVPGSVAAAVLAGVNPIYGLCAGVLPTPVGALFASSAFMCVQTTMGGRLSISPLIVFVSLFVWAGVLGGMGALLAVPLTLMVLTVLEMFRPTRWLVVLVRASPAHEDGEREEAVGRLRGIWDDVRGRTEKLVASD